MTRVDYYDRKFNELFAEERECADRQPLKGIIGKADHDYSIAKAEISKLQKELQKKQKHLYDYIEKSMQEFIKGGEDEAENKFRLKYSHLFLDALLGGYAFIEKEAVGGPLIERINGLMQEYIKEAKDEAEEAHRLKCYHLFLDALEGYEFIEKEKVAEGFEINALQLIIADPNNAGSETCQLALRSLVEKLRRRLKKIM